MPQSATIKSIPRAFRMMKAMHAQGIDWGEDCRRAARAALKEVLGGRMANGIDSLAALAQGRPGYGLIIAAVHAFSRIKHQAAAAGDDILARTLASNLLATGPAPTAPSAFMAGGFT